MKLTRRPAAGFTLIELLVAIFLLAILSAFAYGTLSYVEKAREATQVSFAREREIELAVHTWVSDFEQLSPRPVRQPLGTDFLPAIMTDTSGQNLVTFTRAGWSNGAGLPRSMLQRVTYRFDKDRGVLVRSYTTVLDAPLSAVPIKRDLLSRLEDVRIRYLPAVNLQVTTNNSGIGTAPSNADSASTPDTNANKPDSFASNSEAGGWVRQWPPLDNSNVLTPPPALPTSGAKANALPNNPGANALPSALSRRRPRAVEVTLQLKDLGKIIRLIEVPG